MRVLATRPGIRAAEAGAGRAKPTQTGWESGRGLLLGRNPSWRRAYQALLTSISHDQDLRRKMFRNRLELRGLAAPDGVALLRERDQEMLWGRRRDFLPGSQEVKWRDGNPPTNATVPAPQRTVDPALGWRTWRD